MANDRDLTLGQAQSITIGLSGSLEKSLVSLAARVTASFAVTLERSEDTSSPKRNTPRECDDPDCYGGLRDARVPTTRSTISSPGSAQMFLTAHPNQHQQF